MEIKKIISILLVIASLLLSIPMIGIQAVSILSYGRISVVMPEITAEIKGTGYDPEDISGTLGTETLQINDAHAYDPEEDSTCVYLLVDISTSMRRSFELVKKNILHYVDAMGEHDQVVLMTIGETEVNILLSGGESKEEIIDVVQSLQCNEEGTLFYEALNRAYQLANASVSDFDREYVIAFSDGIDVQTGNSTYEEITRLYSTHSLPLYAACASNSSKEASDRFGELARSSGGDLSIITDEKAFDTLLASINDITILHMEAANNIADGQTRQLSIKIGDSQVEQNIPITRSIADTTAPTVESVSYDPDRSVIVISYSEKVLNAWSVSAYKITDEKGVIVDLAAVYAAEQENAVELKLQNPMQNGTYSIAFNGITDASQEQNALSEKVEFQVTGAVEEPLVTSTPEPKEPEPSAPGWLLPVILFVVLLLIIVIVTTVILLTRKKNAEDEGDAEVIPPTSPSNAVVVEHIPDTPDQIKHHIAVNTAIRLQLQIKTGKAAEQTIVTNVVSSLIVGRSDICDICIDDVKLSRQHFVIENEEGTLYIQDLQSRNGTMLNGIRVGTRQRLHSGDKILAGLSDIYVSILGG